MTMKDHTGKIFGKLTVLSLHHRVFRSSRHGYYNYWLCKCECGNESVVLYNNLRNQNTTSCGCMSSRNFSYLRLTTHGKTNTPTYNSWRAMKDRCYSKNHIEYKRYGALGIEVCERWKTSYENFLQDMGKRPPKHSLDRINPFKNYSPENCRWADYKTQANNTRKKYEEENEKKSVETGKPN